MDADHAPARAVVVDPEGDSFLVREGERSLRVDAAGLAAVVLARRDDPRWVWDTPRVYPVLLAAGVRVGRAWDLRLARAVLRRAAGTPEAAAWPRDEWDDPALAADDGALGIDVAPTPPAAEEHRRQLSLLEGAERPGALRLLITAESAGALAAAEMRVTGLPWSASEHLRVLDGLLGPRPTAGARPARLEALVEEVRAALTAPALNPDSPVELSRALRLAGIAVASTRADDLRRVEHPVVAPLLAYKKLARLHAANGWHWLDAWVRDGRFHPDYVVSGVVTGRWATRGGGALQLPRQIRSAVVADPGWCLVVADAAQLEPRVLAGLAHDRAMATAGHGRDLYDGMVASGAVADRASAKVGMLGALYGATSGDGGRLVPRLAQRFPRALALVEQAARDGERGGTVHTLLGRGSPPPGAAHRAAIAAGGGVEADDALQRRARAAARDRGRFTRNFVVQGTAAEWALCWLADLRQRLWLLGDGELAERPQLVYFLHDEVIVHAPVALAAEVEAAVRAAARTAGRLLFGDFPIDFPLDVAVVERYSDAG
ncbi:bifunctional 3'-5' exonuclease/DNA polymerase [Amnibacterium endophyticum]|uniref:DNA-directed DNA polymerase n=1 Tax=Amnibacterium endophyticum TaxID=2109337 RepID=A0ABW4LHY1_9MICO